MRFALLFGSALAACGGSPGAEGEGAPPPEPAAEVSTDPAEAEAKSPEPAPDLPPVSPEVPSPVVAEPPPLALEGQTIPQVPAVLPPLPGDGVAVFATTAEVRIGEVAVPLDPGSLPTPKALVPIGEALAKTEGLVVLVVDAAVSAGILRRLVDLLPPERSRAVLARGADGAQGLVPLAVEAAADAPEVTIAPDGFHLAERSGGPQLHLEPAQGGDPFDYVGLRNKAKAFRTAHPEVDSVRVGAASEVSAEVLLRALSQIRGPKCTAEPERCWLPQLAFGADIRTITPLEGAARPKIEFPKAGSEDGSPGTVALGQAKVPDTLDAAEVRKVLGQRLGYARMCYFAALADDPALQGKVVLRLTVDANGEVEEVGVPSATLKSVAVEDCLERGVKGLRFTPPTKAPAMVDVPLTFALK